METSVLLLSTNCQTSFKIDLIVWKLFNIFLIPFFAEKFKIDLIVWKLTIVHMRPFDSIKFKIDLIVWKPQSPNTCRAYFEQV